MEIIVLKKLHQVQPASRAQLCEVAQLPRTTVFDVLTRLLNKQIIKKVSRKTKQRRGRPTVFYYINFMPDEVIKKPIPTQYARKRSGLQEKKLALEKTKTAIDLSEYSYTQRYFPCPICGVRIRSILEHRRETNTFETSPFSVISTENTLVNPIRRKIFCFLVANPGVYSSNLFRKLNLPHGTLDWHLYKLLADNMIQTLKIFGKRIYFPSLLRPIHLECSLAELYNSPNTLEVLQVIYINSGINKTNVSSKISSKLHFDTIRYHLYRLEFLALIRTERKGREVHLYPTQLTKLIFRNKSIRFPPKFIEFLEKTFKLSELEYLITIKSHSRLKVDLFLPSKDISFNLTIQKKWIT